jgi:hypothetical protein
MNINNNKENEIQVSVESKFNKLNIFDKNSNQENNHKNCYNPDDKRLWCKECVPHCIIEGWKSGNHDINEFIKDTIYNAKYGYDDYYDSDDEYYYNDEDSGDYPIFLEWVPFDKFEDIKQIGEGNKRSSNIKRYSNINLYNCLNNYYEYR